MPKSSSSQNMASSLTIPFDLCPSTNHQDSKLVWLGIDTENTTFIIGHPRSLVATEIKLAMGSHKTARDYFLFFPPIPREVEKAIEGIEDEIEKISKQIPAHACFISCDAGLQLIARHINAAQPKETLFLKRDDVESLFNRLCNMVSGSPVPVHPFPDDLATTATLIILRECMHHLKFEQITLLSTLPDLPDQA